MPSAASMTTGRKKVALDVTALVGQMFAFFFPCPRRAFSRGRVRTRSSVERCLAAATTATLAVDERVDAGTASYRLTSRWRSRNHAQLATGPALTVRALVGQPDQSIPSAPAGTGGRDVEGRKRKMFLDEEGRVE